MPMHHRSIWRRFREDLYHSPRVVWGREVNLISLGLSRARGKVPADWLHAHPAPRWRPQGSEHNELWSYRIEGDRLLPMRYGTSSDVQLWNTTDLAVEFELSRLRGKLMLILSAAKERSQSSAPSLRSG